MGDGLAGFANIAAVRGAMRGILHFAGFEAADGHAAIDDEICPKR